MAAQLCKHYDIDIKVFNLLCSSAVLFPTAYTVDESRNILLTVTVSVLLNP